MTYLGLHDADGAALLVIDPGHTAGPFLVETVDLGAVDVNDDAEANPSGDGTRDYTRTAGAAAVSVGLTALGDDTGGPYVWLDRLRGLCHPRRRLYLHVQIGDWPAPRRLLVRGLPAPRDLTDPQPDAQFQWRAIQGWLESVDVQRIILVPVGDTVPGLAEPISFPVAFPSASPSGSAPFVVAGTLPTSPTLDIYGPCTGPQIIDDDGELIAFKPAFAIAAGHFVRVQAEGPGGLPLVAGDGDVAQQLYGQLDFTRTTPDLALTLEPGDNRLVFTAVSTGAGSMAVVSWRDRN